MSARNLIASSLFLLGAIVAADSQAANQSFIVNSTLDVTDDNPGDGICHAVGGIAGTCTLRAAIVEANAHAGDHQIALPSGTYMFSKTGIGEDNGATGDLDIKRHITIVNGTDNPPSIYANAIDRVFDVRDGAHLELDNIHVGGGFANSDGNVHGGAIRVNLNADLTLRKVVVATNVANLGGGIYSDGDVVIEDSEFFNNGIVDDHVLTEFANGDAILTRGTLSVTRSSFHDNGVIPGGEGLGLLTAEAAIHLKNNGPADPFFGMINSTVAQNSIGIRSEGVASMLLMNTIANNRGMGFRFNFDIDNMGSGQLYVRHTAITGNNEGGFNCNQLDPVSFPDELDISDQYNASSDDTCGFVGANDFEDIADPFFAQLDNWGGITPALMPRPTSELIDSGGIQCSPSYEDQRGIARPIDGNGDVATACDIGAIEYNPATDPELPMDLFKDSFE
ncbi:MAG: CSLREA domain-containing protein [Xanthomonadales bacterium]|nr:CSLREA domain-containing protein [Xanthomonadales bacterium]